MNINEINQLKIAKSSVNGPAQSHNGSTLKEKSSMNDSSQSHNGSTLKEMKLSENMYNLEMLELEQLNVDLTNQVKDLKKELENVANNNTKFISLIAHDLRSPFITMTNALELLKKGMNDHKNSEVESYMNLVSDSAQQSLNLLDNLVAWAILQNKEVSFNPVQVNMNELLIEEIENVKLSAHQKQINISHFVDTNLEIHADEQMVKTIFRNLISNAIKFTNKGGRITVTVNCSAYGIESAVNDTGVGISQEDQQKLFKNTFHSTKDTGNTRGSGLGLQLCKEFVEMHGGIIQVESEPGLGSRFKFSIPNDVNETSDYK